MKRGIVVYCLSAILPFLVFSMTILAVALPTSDDFGVHEARGNPSTVVSVPVNITNAQNGPIISVIFDISYNSSVIMVSGIQRGNLTSTWDTPSSNNFAWGTRILIVYDGVIEHGIQNGTTGSVVLINFNVVGAPGSSSDINLSNIQLATGAPDYLVGAAPAKDGVFRVDAGVPSVTNPEANPDTIEADGVQETRLNVTVVDDSSEDVVVIVDLTQLGGPAAKVMEKIDDALFSTMTNATPGTPSGTYNLSINATDVLGNYNNTENFTLTVALPPTGSVTGTTVYTCNGTGIADVAVNLTQNGSAIAAAMTDGGGNYTFTDITPDDYYVNASKLRFWSNSTTVTVTAGGTVTADMALWMKGDLNNNCMQADAGDLAMMKAASVGQITPDWRYDLNENGILADAGDLAMMKAASVGEIELL